MEMTLYFERDRNLNAESCALNHARSNGVICNLIEQINLIEHRV